MDESLSVAPAAAARVPELPEPTRDPPPSRVADAPESTPGLTDDHDRIAGGLDHVVVRRMFSAGLALEAALELIGEHRAAGRIHHAVSELDHAITGIRDMEFYSRRPDSPAIRGPG